MQSINFWQQGVDTQLVDDGFSHEVVETQLVDDGFSHEVVEALLVDDGFGAQEVDTQMPRRLGRGVTLQAIWRLGVRLLRQPVNL